MIGLPSKYRFQVHNNCGSEIELGLKYRPQKLNSSGVLIYGAWVSVFSRATNTLASASYADGADIDNTDDLYLGLEIWYAWNFEEDTGNSGDGLVTLRLQSNYDDGASDEYQEDGNGIVLASDFIVGADKTAADVASGIVIF